jgi:predicted Zn-dependent protease
MKKIIIPLLLYSLFAGAPAQATGKAPKVWLVQDLTRAPAETIQLRDERERLVKTIETRQIVYLYAVLTGIQEAAEITADMYLMEGADPNALATKGKNDENIIAINFAMLDMIKTDVDAAAAIIGHELAHLKLNHQEKSKQAIERNQNSMITAANTRYSRDNEREADYLGIIWAIEAGYDPAGAVRVHEELYKLSRRRSGAFIGSHPSSIERITVLKALVRRLSK